MACCSIEIELSFSNLILFAVLIFALKKAIKLFNLWKVDQMLERWNAPSRNKLILHNVWRGKTMPNISPYGLKLEMFLKMAKIKYELDTKDPMGPKGKLPWISHNGIHVADSQFCVEYLRKKFNVELNEKHSLEDLAIARAVRIMLEDRFIGGLAWFRWVENPNTLPQLLKLPAIFKHLLFFQRGNVKKRLETNGIGKHTPSEIYQLTEDDLRSVSNILANKKFICGDDPCEDDAAIFANIAQCVWGAPGSSYERLVNGELKNLKEYCERMQSDYWPDWETCIDRS